MRYRDKDQGSIGPTGAMTVDEVANHLRISRSGVYRLFKTGALPKAVILGRTVARRVDVENFLARCVASTVRRSSVGSGAL